MHEVHLRGSSISQKFDNHYLGIRGIDETILLTSALGKVT